MPTPRKLSDILRDIFGSNFGKLSDFDFYDLGKNTKPEDFMGNSDYTKTEETGTDE